MKTIIVLLADEQQNIINCSYFTTTQTLNKYQLKYKQAEVELGLTQAEAVRLSFGYELN